LLYSVIIIPGFSIVDIPHINGLGLPFGHLFSSCKADKLIKECVKLLKKEKLIGITQDPNRTELFDIESDVKELLIEVWNIYDGLILPMLIRKWLSISNSKKERQWYEEIYGEKGADEDFTRWNNERRTMKESNKLQARKRLENTRKYLEDANKTIIFSINQLRQKYTYLPGRSLFEFLIEEIIYPEILRSDNPSKGDGKVKVLFGIGRDVVDVRAR
jgi:hypothetical protein